MKAQDRVRSDLGEIAALAEDLRELSPQARANWRSWSGLGFPSGGGNGRSSGMGNPTEAAALSSVERRERDRFGREWAEHDAAIAGALHGLRRALRLASSAVNTTAQPGADGCELCERVMVNGRPHPHAWQEVYSRAVPGPLVGELSALGRCSWHWDFLERWGEDASPDLSMWHLENRGRAAPKELIRAEHPEAWARTMQRRAS